MNRKYTRFAMRMLCKLNKVSRYAVSQDTHTDQWDGRFDRCGVKGVYMIDLARKTRHLRTTYVHYPLVKNFVTWYLKIDILVQ